MLFMFSCFSHQVDLKTTTKRGKLSVLVRSPDGTVSTLLAPRPFDDIRTGLGLFKTWPMMSVHFWGEAVEKAGDDNWYLIIKNGGDRPAVLHDFQVGSSAHSKLLQKRIILHCAFQFTFYGTEEDPQPGVPIKLERKDEVVAKSSDSPSAPHPGIVNLDPGVFGAERIEDGWQLEEGLVLVGVGEEEDESSSEEEEEVVQEDPEVVFPLEAESRIISDEEDLVTLEIDPEEELEVLPPVINSDEAEEGSFD